jgi:hypothetical protein
MKWWFLFFLRGMALGGPYDSQQECTAALAQEMARPISDQGFDNAKAGGVCFEGIQPTIVAR